MKRLLAMASVSLITGCANLPPSSPAAPQLPAAFLEPHDQVNGIPVPDAAWWHLFKDSGLNRLEEQLDSGSPRLAAAVARLGRARAELGIQEAGALPQVSFGLDTANTRTSANVIGRSLAGRTVNDHALSFGASWEPDLFGRVAGEVAASKADIQSSVADVAALRLSLEAEVARDYLQLRSVDAQLVLTRQSLVDQQSLLTMAEQRLAIGTTSLLEVEQLRSSVQSSRGQIEPLVAQRARLVHAIATLMGTPAAEFVLPVADEHLSLPRVSSGVPTDLLSRRPDVAAAADHVLAANERLGVARKAWMPSFVLSGTAGLESTSLAQLLTLPSRAWALGPALLTPLFDGGRRHAMQQQAQSDVDTAAADYRGRVVSAINEVEDQLSTLDTLSRQMTLQRSALEASALATKLSEARLAAGAIDRGEVLKLRLDSTSKALAVELVEQQRAQHTVDLIGALGGGWSSGTLPGREMAASARLDQ